MAAFQGKSHRLLYRSHVLSQPDGVLSDRSGFRTDGDNGSLDGHFHSLEFISLCKRRKQGKMFLHCQPAVFWSMFRPAIITFGPSLKTVQKNIPLAQYNCLFWTGTADPCLYHWFCSSCRNRRNPGSRHLKYFTGHQICLQSGGLCLWN